MFCDSTGAGWRVVRNNSSCNGLVVKWSLLFIGTAVYNDKVSYSKFVDMRYFSAPKFPIIYVFIPFS